MNRNETAAATAAVAIGVIGVTWGLLSLTGGSASVEPSNSVATSDDVATVATVYLQDCASGQWDKALALTTGPGKAKLTAAVPVFGAIASASCATMVTAPMSVTIGVDPTTATVSVQGDDPTPMHYVGGKWLVYIP